VIGGTEGVRRFAAAVPGSGDGVGRGRSPVGLVGHGSDIANLALYLCSPAARFLSGQVIAVDGAASVDLLKLDLAELDPGRS
jgi:NAD(P)-dependent dehydrogenase (short-subunit alcohol dehydrogenase family)